MDDDSVGFADLERAHVRTKVGVVDFDWVASEAPSPRNALPVPLDQARVALVSTAGAHVPGGRPLSPGGRALLLPAAEPVELTHGGYDTARAMTDLDVVYPVAKLTSLAQEGTIGSLAPTIVSTMGFVPDGRRLFSHAVPDAVERLRDEQVHLALLVPS